MMKDFLEGKGECFNYMLHFFCVIEYNETNDPILQPIIHLK